MTQHDTPGRPGGRPAIRIGDAERQRMIDTLQEHVSAGRLDMAEFERRVEHATGAVYDRDLDGLLDDLPPIGGDTARGRGSGAPADERGRRGRASSGWWPTDAGPRGFPPWGARIGLPGPLLVLGGIALVVLTHGWILFPLLLLAVMTGRGPCGPGGHRRRRGHPGRRHHDPASAGPPWSRGADLGDRLPWWEHDDEAAGWDEPDPIRPTWPGRYHPDRDDDDRTM